LMRDARYKMHDARYKINSGLLSCIPNHELSIMFDLLNWGRNGFDGEWDNLSCMSSFCQLVKLAEHV
jgi:hypothetical protein